MLITPRSPSASANDVRAEVAICVGGSTDCLSEYLRAKELCLEAGKPWMTFVCNDTITIFPDHIDNAVTLHPDKMPLWLDRRRKQNLDAPGLTWCHRPSRGIDRDTKDWGGSSGLIMVKIARESGFTHVIVCGVPMTVEDGHILRKVRWLAAHGFRRGWQRHTVELKPFVRSYSGWTNELFGAPERVWLDSVIPDPLPPRHEHEQLKA